VPFGRSRSTLIQRIYY